MRAFSISTALILLVVIVHVWVLSIETLLWNTPIGRVVLDAASR
jgi:uncharacterized membrane protein